MILAPLRGVTGRCFRETFAPQIAEAGFTEAITPFITINAGVDPLKDRELRFSRRDAPLKLTPQLIGKDPEALRVALVRLKDAGFETADLNCGCPFPMVRNKGRGSGLLRTGDVLRRMLEVGSSVMGDGCFSVKARLGVERRDELLKLMPLLNVFPLRFLTVHVRTAKQMYEGAVDRAAFEAIRQVAAMPLVYNGDVALEALGDCPKAHDVMVGRGFVRALGARADAPELLARYIAASKDELGSAHPVLGRIKELLAYWCMLPRWRKRWSVVKMARSLGELEDAACA